MYVRMEAYLMRHPLLDLTISYGYILLKCYLFVFVLTNFICKPVYIQGSSMYPTISNGSFGISSVFHQQLQAIDRFDIVMFHQGDDILVKRIIALEYDTIEVKHDILYINDKQVEEPYLQTNYYTEKVKKNNYFTKDFGPITLKKGEYFVMGDNRLDSYDSRIFGAISMDAIISKDTFLIKK